MDFYLKIKGKISMKEDQAEKALILMITKPPLDFIWSGIILRP